MMHAATIRTLDIFVRWLFASPGHEGILIHFLSAVLGDVGEAPISEVAIKNPFKPGEYKGQKEFVLDVAAVDILGRQFDIEIQSANHASYKSRALLYWARLHASQLSSGDDYCDTKPTVGIHLCAFKLFTEIADRHVIVDARVREHGDIVLSEDFCLHFIEIPKFKDLDRGGFLSDLEKLVLWFTLDPVSDTQLDPDDQAWIDRLPPILRESPMYRDMEKKYREFMTDENLRAYAESRFRFITDQKNWLHEAERSGLAEGLQRGLKEGREEGRKEGREEEKADIARRLFKLGLTREQVVEATGLSDEEIEAL